MNVVENGCRRIFLTFSSDAKCSVVDDATRFAIGFKDAVPCWTRRRGVYTENPKTAVRLLAV